MQQSEVEIGLLRRVATLEIEMRQVKEMLRVFENKTFNQSEAARMLNISSNTLARYRRLGIITPIDGTTRYTWGEVKRFMKVRKIYEKT